MNSSAREAEKVDKKLELIEIFLSLLENIVKL